MSREAHWKLDNELMENHEPVDPADLAEPLDRTDPFERRERFEPQLDVLIDERAAREGRAISVR